MDLTMDGKMIESTAVLMVEQMEESVVGKMVESRVETTVIAMG